MKPKTRQPKLIGEWVEMKFMVRAAETGLTVSKPYGDSARFDFVIGQKAPLHRVQVRGTSVLSPGQAYVVPLTHGGLAKPYALGDFDICAAYVIPHDLWYLIPLTVIRPARRYLRLYAGRRPGQWENFREAWHLLSGKK